jgi:hypothetical protein
MCDPKRLSRRDFLKWGGAASLSLLLAACGPRKESTPTLVPRPTLPPRNTPQSQPSPAPTSASTLRTGNLADALIYTIGYATAENMPYVESFDADILTRGFLLFLNSNAGWIPLYQDQIARCQAEKRLFLVGIQAAVLVEQGQELPQIEPDDPALAVPMDTLSQWPDYACRTADGQTLREKGLPFAHACINNATFRDFFQGRLQTIVDSGADGVHIDELPTRYFTQHEGYCEACMAGLRDFLASKYTAADLQSRYGIADIQAFDFREYLAAEGNLETPPRSPLHKEWWLFQLANLAQVEREVFAFCKSYASQQGRTFIVNSNAYEPEREPKHIVEMTLTDYASIGTGMTIDLRQAGQVVSTLRIPPSYSYIPVYRLAQAVMPGKPVSLFIDGPGGAETMQGLATQQQKDIVRWLFAEAYAAGARFHVPYPSVGYYGPLEECQQYAQFVGQGRPLYMGTTHLAEVGVLFSYASQIWDYWAGADNAVSSHRHQWYGLAQALTDLSIQYDVLFAPDGQVLPDHLALDDLLRYPTLVVPWAYALNDAQIGLLADYAQRGGHLVILGDLGNYQENKDPREVAIAPNLERLGATILPNLDLETYLNEPQGGAATGILTEVEALFPTRQVVLSDDSVTAQLYQSDQALYVHLVNKALGESGFQSRRDLQVQVALPAGFQAASQATYLSPEEATPTTLSLVQQGDVVEVTIPLLEVYGVVMIPNMG